MSNTQDEQEKKFKSSVPNLGPPIFFWSDKKYECFSNFYPSPMIVDGKKWPTVEHVFQAAKTEDPVEQEKIRLARTPKDSKRLGRQVKLRSDWEDIKYMAMRRFVSIKFSVEPFKSILLESGNRDIYEDSPYDDIWGTGVKGGIGIGKNYLGDILMEVRGDLKRDQAKWIGKDTSVIPRGPYCYTIVGSKDHPQFGKIPETKACPYHDYVPEDNSGAKHTQNNGYCHYLEMGDWDMRLGLLWDQCKHCHENDDDEWYEECAP